MAKRFGVPGSEQHLNAIRFAVLGVWLVVVVATPYPLFPSFLPIESDGFGAGRVLFGFDFPRAILSSSSTLAILQWGTAAALFLGLLRPVRPVLLLAALGVFVLDLTTKAISAYPNHAQFNALISLFVLAMFAPEKSWHSQEEDARRRESVLWLLGVLMVLPYTFIGVNRVLEGGPSLFVGDGLPRYLAYTSRLYSAYPFGIDLRLLDFPLVAMTIKFSFFVTTVLEIISPLILVSRRFRYVWLFCMSGFHLATLFLMNILFWENLVLIWVLFGWNLLDRRRSGAIDRLGAPVHS